MNDIWKERGILDKARRKKREELMREYDEATYYPALKSLRERCAQQGHREGSPFITGLGWVWVDCAYCGVRLKSIGPEE